MIMPVYFCLFDDKLSIETRNLLLRGLHQSPVHKCDGIRMVIIMYTCIRRGTMTTCERCNKPISCDHVPPGYPKPTIMLKIALTLDNTGILLKYYRNGMLGNRRREITVLPVAHCVRIRTTFATYASFLLLAAYSYHT
jgi:hypothetical protein